MTDHKPLVTLFNNPSSQPTARIERWLMNHLCYLFTIIYQLGQTNPADYASRHPVDVATAEERDDTSETEHHVAFIGRNAAPKAMTLNEVEIATANGRVLLAVMLCMMSDRWHQPPSDVSLAELSRYENVKNGLTCTDTVFLKSNRIVIPTELQKKRWTSLMRVVSV